MIFIALQRFLLHAVTGCLLTVSTLAWSAPILDCTDIAVPPQYKLQTSSPAQGLEQVSLIDSVGIKQAYLVKGIRKLPVKEETAVFGSLIMSSTKNLQDSILLGPASSIEMYSADIMGEKSGLENLIVIYDHHKPIVESVNIKTRKITQKNSDQRKRILFQCNNYQEYLQYIKKKDFDPDQSWNSTSNRKIQRLATEFAAAYVDQGRVFNNQFMGVETWQNPFDMWVYQQLITELKPDIIIETGTAHGGSALFFATILNQVNSTGRVITIEIDPEVEANIQKAKSYRIFKKHVSVIKGDSVSSDTLKQVRKLIDELKATKKNLSVMVTLDSLHSDKHVLEEIKHYANFVTPGSYLLVQDTIIDSNQKFLDWFVRPWVDYSTAGPAAAVRKFLETNQNFQTDNHLFNAYFTFNPGGALRRKN